MKIPGFVACSPVWKETADTMDEAQWKPFTNGKGDYVRYAHTLSGVVVCLPRRKNASTTKRQALNTLSLVRRCQKCQMA